MDLVEEEGNLAPSETRTGDIYRLARLALGRVETDRGGHHLRRGHEASKWDGGEGQCKAHPQAPSSHQSESSPDLLNRLRVLGEADIDIDVTAGASSGWKRAPIAVDSPAYHGAHIHERWHDPSRCERPGNPQGWLVRRMIASSVRLASVR